MSAFRVMYRGGGAATALGLTAAERRSRPSCAAAAALSTSATASATATSSTPLQHQQLVVYQYKICPFCSKVKTYLDFLKLPYASVEVNPLTKGELSKVSKDYKKVPVLTVQPPSGETQLLTDSEHIIAFITANLAGSGRDAKAIEALLPADTDKWITWSDKRLAVMLYPNITRSLAESWECFEYVAHEPTWSLPTQIVTRSAGAVAMMLANGKIKKKYGIVDERKELKACLAEWTDALGGKTFLHGDCVTLPDLMVFGVLRSISGLATFREIMTENDALRGWYERVDGQVVSMDSRK